MLQRIRDRVSSEEKGFTLIELLVVVLIIGILAAIAIPAFLGQRSKAQDSAAKSMSRNAATAAEAYAADKGDYTAMDFAALKAIEPSLADTGGVKPAAANEAVKVTLSGTTGYTVSTQSKSNDYYNLTKVGSSNTTFRCKAAAATTACSSNDW